MELLCPECLGQLTPIGDAKLRCTIHGGVYDVLYRRLPMAAPRVGSAGLAASSAPSAPLAAAAPVGLGTPLGGGPDAPVAAPVPSVSAESGLAPIAATPRYPGMRCVQHPAVDATAKCDNCGGYMCATCDFALPGGIHLCPTCAVSANDKLSPRRRNALAVSLVLGVWCTVFTGLLFAGAFRKMAAQPGGAQVVGALLSIGLLIPGIIGFAMALGAIDRRLRNPPVLWVATIWNGVIVGLFILLSIIGLMR